MSDNLMVRATERPSYGWTDPRAIWGSSAPNYWHVIWMAVSSCCGIEGETEPVQLPRPAPEYHGSFPEAR